MLLPEDQNIKIQQVHIVDTFKVPNPQNLENIFPLEAAKIKTTQIPFSDYTALKVEMNN